MEIKHADDIGAGLAILSAVIVFVTASSLPPGPNQGDPGPAFFPQMIAGFATVLALFIITKNRVRSEGDTVTIKFTRAKTPVLVLGFLITYVVVMPRVGFVPSTIGFLAITMKSSDVRNFWKAMAFSVVMVFVLYYVFTGIFHIRLPEIPLLPFHALGLGWEGV